MYGFPTSKSVACSHPLLFMQNSKSILEEITKVDLFDLNLLDSLLKTHASLKSSSPSSSLATTLEILKKKNQNIHNEIDKLKVVENKKNEMYNKINNERLRLAKKYISLEDSIMNVRTQIERHEKEIEDLNKRLADVNKPSYNQLYLVILRGLGVEFLKTSTSKVCRIRNKVNKNITEVEIEKKEEPVYLTTNRIWEKMM